MVVRKMRGQLVKILSAARIRYYRCMGISIGKGCYISSGAHLDVRRGKVTIGNNVSIASGSYILSHTGYQPTKESEETALEDNVKVFVNAVVLPGVRIGRDSVVGAGAVVARNVPPKVLVMGNPARVVNHLEQVKLSPRPSSGIVAGRRADPKLQCAHPSN